jgi:hypothetical protein
LINACGRFAKFSSQSWKNHTSTFDSCDMFLFVSNVSTRLQILPSDMPGTLPIATSGHLWGTSAALVAV